MSVSTPLLKSIEPDEEPPNTKVSPANARPTPSATDLTNAEAGIAGIFRQSSHPFVLSFLLFFRTAAIAVYVLCDFITNDYVLPTVVVVVLLAVDFWYCRNVAGRRLVGLRFWNQVDQDGESYWVFESRDPSRPANATDSRLFWIILYTFPLLWAVLLFVALIKLSFSFFPIIILALVFNATTVIGFTYADKDAKLRWTSSSLPSSWSLGVGGHLLGDVVKKGISRVFS